MINDAVLVEKLIFLREQTVGLDADLTKLYGVSTKQINEQLKPNRERFPMDFASQLHSKEWERSLKVAKCDLKLGREKNPTMGVYRIWRCTIGQCFTE